MLINIRLIVLKVNLDILNVQFTSELNIVFFWCNRWERSCWQEWSRDECDKNITDNLRDDGQALSKQEDDA